MVDKMTKKMVVEKWLKGDKMSSGSKASSGQAWLMLEMLCQCNGAVNCATQVEHVACTSSGGSYGMVA